MTRTHICPLSLHDALPIFNSSLRHGSFAAFWLHNNKGRLTRGCNPTSSKFIHTWLRFGEIMRGSLSAECEKGVKSAVALAPALQPIDGVAVSYIDAAVALGNTINEMDKYYTQENYKDDAFAKGKTLHQTFLKNLEAFEAVAESYHAAIQEINDKRQLA